VPRRARARVAAGVARARFVGVRLPRFRDRYAAGVELAAELERRIGDHQIDRPDAVVLALPRGGVAVGFEIATRLHAPLDVIVVRRVRVPGHAELAMGAVAFDDVELVDEQVAAMMHVSPEAFDVEVERERDEVDRRERTLRAGRPALDVHGRIAVVVDDGVATGATVAMAIEAVRARGPARIVVALPIAAAQTSRELDTRADELVCLETLDPPLAAAACYGDFTQLADADVRELLATAELDLGPRVASPTIELGGRSGSSNTRKKAQEGNATEKDANRDPDEP
jgi:putative phosphoribosyl transferase